MKKYTLNWLFFLQILLPCTVLAQTAVLSEKRLNILTFGDSNGTFPHSWPQQLKLALPNAQVYNISKSGRTIGFLNLGDSTLNSLSVIGQNLQKAVEFTGDRPYDFVVIELGTNDAKAVFADRQSEVPENLEKLIHTIHQWPSDIISQAKIILVSPPPYGTKAQGTAKYAGGSQRVEAMAESFAAVARQYGCLFVNGRETPGLDIESMTADGLHLDAYGSRKLIEPIVALMLN